MNNLDCCSLFISRVVVITTSVDTAPTCECHKFTKLKPRPDGRNIPTQHLVPLLVHVVRCCEGACQIVTKFGNDIYRNETVNFHNRELGRGNKRMKSPIIRSIQNEKVKYNPVKKIYITSKQSNILLME